MTDFSSYFQAVNCRRLGFKPKMTVRQLGGRKKTRARPEPAPCSSTCGPAHGDANIKSVSVTLSNAFEIDQRHLGNICSEKELAEKQMRRSHPDRQGQDEDAAARPAALGPVYAVSGSGGLPRLAFILDGQVKLVPRADTGHRQGRPAADRRPVIPDAPIGHFRLNIFGGKRGYLVNTRDICKQRPAVVIDFTGQNGKTRSQKIRVKTACGKRSKARHKRHLRR